MSVVLLILGVVVLSALFGALGGYLAVRQFGRERQATTLSSSRYFCEVCGDVALPYRTADGRRLCAAHKVGG